jgi:hypothetical protein
MLNLKIQPATHHVFLKCPFNFQFSSFLRSVYNIKNLKDKMAMDRSNSEEGG